MKNRKSYRTSIPALVLLFIYLANPLKLSLPYLDYSLNYEYIKNFLCENKEKPELKCDGKCYLSKALKENQETGENHQRLVPKNYFADELPIEEISIPLSEIFAFHLDSFHLDIYQKSFPKHSTPPPKG